MEGEGITGSSSKAFFPIKPQSQPPAGHCFALALGSKRMRFAELQRKRQSKTS